MTMNIFYDKDADLSLIQSKRIVVIGYGSQGHAHANNLKDSGCNVVVGLRPGSASAAKAEQAGLTVKQIREAGLNLPIVSGDGFDTELVTSVPGDKLANDVYFSTHTYREDDRPEVVAFIAAYEKEYGRPPENAFAPLGYDAVGLIADAINRAGSTEGKALRDALAGTKGFKAVTGEITYSRPSGVPMKGVSIISVHDGKYKVEEVWFPKQ